jgi:hypothetical protein
MTNESLGITILLPDKGILKVDCTGIAMFSHKLPVGINNMGYGKKILLGISNIILHLRNIFHKRKYYSGIRKDYNSQESSS